MIHDRKMCALVTSSSFRKIRVRAFSARSIGFACAILGLTTLSSCTRTPQQKEANFLQAGRNHVRDKDFARAIIDFRNAAQAVPQDAEPHYQLALAYVSAGYLQDGVNELLKTAALDPKQVAAQLKLAEILTANKNLQAVKEGEKHAEQVLGVSPGNPDALYALATAELRLEDPADAVQHLEQALQKVPQNLNASMTLALVKLRNNDVAGAEKVMQKAADEAPGSPQHAIALGRFWLLVKKPRDAEKEFRRALVIDPQNGSAMNALANLLYHTGRAEEAEPLFRRAAALPDKTFHPLHAIFLLETGKSEQAIAEFKQLYETNRKDRDARTQLVSAYFRVGRPAEAEQVLAGALRVNAKDTEALLQRAELYLLESKYEQAQTDLTGVLRFRPDSPEVHLLMARVHRARGLGEAERQELAEALRLKPKFLAARIELAHSFTLAGQASAAIDLLNETPGEDKDSLAVITEKNAAFYALGDDAALRKGVDQGLALGRTSELLLQDGLYKLRQRDFKGARISLEEALSRQPEEWRALEALAMSFAGEKKIPEATAAVRAHVARVPKSATAQEFLGTWLMRTGDTAGARAAFEAARTLASDPSQADFQLAELDLREGKLDPARTLLLALLARQPGNLALLLDLGQEEFRARHMQQAIAYYNQAVQKDSNNVPALNNLAYLLADTGADPDRALELAQQVKQLAPNDTTVDDTIGWAYFKKGLFQTAIEYFRQSKSETPRWKCHLAMAYVRIGDQRHATELLQAALKEDPSVPEAQSVLQLLADVKR